MNSPIITKAKERLDSMPNLLPGFLIACIWCGSITLCSLPFLLIETSSLQVKLFMITLTPVNFIFSFVTIAGLLSRLGQKGIIPGNFPRQALHKVYFLRRIFGACWTQVYYFVPVYAVCLAIPLMKKYLFRLFGYKFSTNFVTYPDTWLRDLPILKFEDGTYIANRAVLGTNLCLSDGNIYVDKIILKQNSLIGHLAGLAPGTRVEENGEIGINGALGLKSQLGKKSKICPYAGVNHGVKIGNNVEIGSSSYIGLKVVIGDNIKVPAGANIPAGAVIQSPEDVQKYFSSETELLNRRKDILGELLQAHLEHAK